MEIEVKALEIDKKEIEKKLAKLGAKKIFDGEFEFILFDRPNEELKKKEALLRLRKEGSKIVLAFKKKISMKRVKKMEEIEVEVSDFEKTRKILKQLGFVEFLKAKKHRTSYKLEGTHFDIDTYKGKLKKIPTFMEIEAESEKEIARYIKLLNLPREKIKSWTLKELLEYYV